MRNVIICLLPLLVPMLAHSAAFSSSTAPDPGKMRVYVFRPAFTDQAFPKEAPVLRLNGKVVGRFAQGSFMNLQLEAGKHEISIEPNATGSPLWRTSFPVKAVDGKTLYLGFWVAQKLNKRLSRGAAFVAGPLLAYMLDGDNEPSELRLDLMDQGDAEPMLRECEELASE